MNPEAKTRAFVRALLQTALDNGTVDAVRRDAEAIIAQWDHSPELRAFCFAHRPETPDNHADAVSALWGDSLTPAFMVLLKQLARWGGLSLLRSVAQTFLEQCDIAQEHYVAQAEFACSPEKGDLDSLRAKLTAKYNNKVEMVVSINPSLLAGFRLTVRDSLTDASLSGRLARLKNLANFA